jgi:hypothetical protein
LRSTVPSPTNSTRAQLTTRIIPRSRPQCVRCLSARLRFLYPCLCALVHENRPPRAPSFRRDDGRARVVFEEVEQ